MKSVLFATFHIVGSGLWALWGTTFEVLWVSTSTVFFKLLGNSATRTPRDWRLRNFFLPLFHQFRTCRLVVVCVQPWVRTSTVFFKLLGNSATRTPQNWGSIIVSTVLSQISNTQTSDCVEMQWWQSWKRAKTGEWGLGSWHFAARPRISMWTSILCPHGLPRRIFHNTPRANFSGSKPSQPTHYFLSKPSLVLRSLRFQI